MSDYSNRKERPTRPPGETLKRSDITPGINNHLNIILDQVPHMNKADLVACKVAPPENLYPKSVE